MFIIYEKVRSLFFIIVTIVVIINIIIINIIIMIMIIIIIVIIIIIMAFIIIFVCTIIMINVLIVLCRDIINSAIDDDRSDNDDDVRTKWTKGTEVKLYSTVTCMCIRPKIEGKARQDSHSEDEGNYDDEY